MQVVVPERLSQRVLVGLSVPLGIQYDKDPKKMNKQEKSNKNRFDTAQKDGKSLSRLS